MKGIKLNSSLQISAGIVTGIYIQVTLKSIYESLRDRVEERA